jgi:hypothetical protein
MSDILDETRNYLECGECPWYKLCVSPMRFTAEDIRRQISSQPGINQPNDAATQELMAKMAAAAQNQMLEGCPVFIEKLRCSAELAKRIKDIVQNWNEEQSTQS